MNSVFERVFDCGKEDTITPLFWAWFKAVLAKVSTSQPQSFYFQASKKEKNETPDRKCTTKEFRFTHLFYYTEINDVPPHLDTIMTLEPRKASYAGYIKLYR